MKQSGHLNPSELIGTGCPVTTKYGRTPPYKHGGVDRQQQQLQDGFTKTPLPLIDVTWVDSGLLIHSFLSAIAKITSYGNLTRTLLAYVCGSGGNEIHLLFDTYHPMSLNVSERKLRGADDRPFLITGPEQPPIQGCQRLLQNGIFNDQLAMFLLTSLVLFGKMRTRSAHPGHGFDSLNYRRKEKNVYYTLKWVLGPASTPKYQGMSGNGQFFLLGSGVVYAEENGSVMALSVLCGIYLFI